MKKEFCEHPTCLRVAKGLDRKTKKYFCLLHLQGKEVENAEELKINE